jgi:hypothetical protein
MPIFSSVLAAELTAFAKSAGVAGSAARVSLKYAPPPNMANRTLAATESWAIGSPGSGLGVPTHTAVRTGAQAEQTFALAWADCRSLDECHSHGRTHAAMARPVAITAIARATSAIDRDDSNQRRTGECFGWLFSGAGWVGVSIDISRRYRIKPSSITALLDPLATNSAASEEIRSPLAIGRRCDDRKSRRGWPRRDPGGP